MRIYMTGAVAVLISRLLEDTVKFKKGEKPGLNEEIHA
jgi:hypothetical protein